MPHSAVQPRLTPGRLVYLTWHLPVGFAKRITKHGPMNSIQAAIGERKMRAAAAVLPVSERRADSGSEVAFLTGRNHWHQTLFCAWSLLRVTGCDLAITMYDDGSLDQAIALIIKRSLPGVRIVRRSDAEASLDRFLPASRFPTLRRHRLVYPHLRKLTDIHVGHRGAVVVLDSDMLFLKRPTTMLNWLTMPTGACCMQDYITSYGYDTKNLQELTEKPILDCVNVGVAGLISDEIDWHRLESRCAKLLSDHGSSYFLEQALCAVLFSERPTLILSPADYIVGPTPDQIALRSGALQHYVAESKYAYFQTAWKRMAVPKA